MFCWQSNSNKHQQIGLSSFNYRSAKTPYFSACFDISRELLLARELDKAAAALSIIFYEYLDHYETCTRGAFELFRMSPTDSSLDKEALRFYRTILKRSLHTPFIVVPTLIEITRFYWRNKKYLLAYETWIDGIKKNFFGILEKEALAFLGITSFVCWKYKVVDSDEEMDASDLEDDDSGDGDDYENDDYAHFYSEDEESSEEESAENDIDIVKKEDEKKKKKEIDLTGEKKLDIDKDVSKETNEEFDSDLFFKHEREDDDNDKVDYSFKFVTTRSRKKQLTEKQTKIRRKLLEINNSSTNNEDKFLYRAKEYLSLSLACSPGCETSFAHMLDLLIEEELYTDAKQLCLSFCEDSPLNPFGYRMLSKVMESYFESDVKIRIQVYAKILDIDPICKETIKSILKIYSEKIMSIKIIKLCLTSFLEEYYHLKEYLDLTEEESTLLEEIKQSK